MPEARRDKWGRYLVVPPSGGRPQGYTRATTVAKSLDDGGGLIPWKAALAMTGMMRRPGLRSRFEVLLSEHPEAGPWYGSPDSKTAVKALVEDCAEAGGSSDRAEVGTALHAIVEQLNRGETPTVSQDSTRADLAAYAEKMAAAGITFDLDMIEATVVLDAWKVAGTADMGAARIPGLGAVIADLKTGTNLEYSWQSIAVQLAIYAHGDNIYRQGDATDGSLDTRLPVPDVRQDIAVVIHLPAGEARCTLYEIDIAAGWEAFERSMWARQWRTRKDLARPLSTKRAVTLVDGTPTVDQMRLALLALVAAMPEDRKAMLRDSWPKDLPPLRRAEFWTAELILECASFVAAASGDTSVAPGVAADTTAAPSGAVAADSSNGSTAATPGGHNSPADGPMTIAQWDTLTHEAQERALSRGHLPLELRCSHEQLDTFRARLQALPADQMEWVGEQARLISLPNLGHPHLWSIERGKNLETILDSAASLATVHESHHWPTLVAAAGVTKAAAMRKAKALAAEIGIEKIGSALDRLPTSGEFASRLAAWLDEQARAKAAA